MEMDIKFGRSVCFTFNKNKQSFGFIKTTLSKDPQSHVYIFKPLYNNYQAKNPLTGKATPL